MNRKKIINLALQGGGSHGAFTWGVLDRLLEEEDLEIKAISGTSAGSMNGVCLAYGLIKEGKIGAKKKLEEFWYKISQANAFVAFNKFAPQWGQALQQRSLIQCFNFITQFLSPYQFNPLNQNPIEKILKEIIDFDSLRSTQDIRLFISATNVETNRIKVFDNNDICIEALLASSCLPSLHQAVKWKENYFWDGGFMGNPILEPLIYNCESRDLLIIQVNPINKPGIPKTSHEILDRLNEITFNSSLMRELRTIVNIKKLSDEQFCQQNNPYADLRLHLISDESFMAELGASSKFNINWDFLNTLKAKGREAAENWLIKNLNQVGKTTSMDLSKWHIETPTTTCLTLK